MIQKIAMGSEIIFFNDIIGYMKKHRRWDNKCELLRRVKADQLAEACTKTTHKFMQHAVILGAQDWGAFLPARKCFKIEDLDGLYANAIASHHDRGHKQQLGQTRLWRAILRRKSDGGLERAKELLYDVLDPTSGVDMATAMLAA